MRNENDLRRALNAGLSPAALSPSDRQKLLLSIRGGKTMIKKRFVPVLALILVLLSLTALAVSNWESIKGYLDTVRGMEAAGELARWSDEDKLKLLSAMNDAGLIEGDERLTVAFDETKPLAERAAQADAIISERYGAGYFDRHAIEDVELPLAKLDESEQQAYEAWNEENLLKYYNPDEIEESIDETRLYYETAKLLTASGRFPRELVREVKVSGEYREDERDRRWVVTVSIDEQLYREAVGNAEKISDFDSEKYAYRQDGMLCFRYFLDEGGYFLGKDDLSDVGLCERLTLDEALPIAEQALLMRIDQLESIDELRKLTLESFYGDSSVYDTEGGRFRTACCFLYRDAEGEGVYLVDIDALTGEVLTVYDYAAKDALREKERTWLADIREQLRAAGVSDDLNDASKQYIWSWSVEEKAAWSSVARPIVLGYIEEHPEVKSYLADHDWNNLFALTRFAYGVPDEKAISQEKAYEIACAESLRMGANERYLKDSTNITYFYDVSVPERPLWKVRIGVTYGAMDLDHPYVSTMPFGYFTVIHAYTGEVLGAYPAEVNTEMKDLV